MDTIYLTILFPYFFGDDFTRRSFFNMVKWAKTGVAGVKTLLGVKGWVPQGFSQYLNLQPGMIEKRHNFTQSGGMGENTLFLEIDKTMCLKFNQPQDHSSGHDNSHKNSLSHQLLLSSFENVKQALLQLNAQFNT